MRRTVPPTEIRFYRANEKPYGAFSNLYKRELVFEGETYPTSEHAYQAGKPRKDAVRMRKVLRAKFTQHEDLKQLLLSTGEARLIESPKTDNAVNRIWGEVNGKGKNMLGVLLMELRSEL